MKPFDKLEVWCIEWEDAMSMDSWANELAEPELAWIMTVGVIVNETKSILQIALNIDSSNEAVSCMMNIPRINIKRRKKLWLLKDLKKQTTTPSK